MIFQSHSQLSSDRDHINVPTLITLLKAFGPNLLGPASSKDGVTTEGQERASTETVLLDVGIAPRFRKLCETYFSTLCKRIVRDHERLQEQDRRNDEAYIKSGEIFEDRQQNYEKMTKAFEKVVEGGKALSELLSVDMPRLVDSSKPAGAGLGINMDNSSSLRGDQYEQEFATGKSPWEDEDTRRFYEDVVDLKDIIPPSILGKAGAAGDKVADVPALDGGDGDEVLEAVIEDDAASTHSSPVLEQQELGSTSRRPSATTSPLLTAGKDASEGQLQAGPAAQLSALLARLPDLSSRSLIDSAAVDFALLNSKAARKRLIKHLGSIPRNRSDLIPYYARLVATLSPYMPDISKGLIEILIDEFKYLQRKRMADIAETRNKNARYLGELTKFGVTPSHAIFHCLKVCLDDFSGPSIEYLSTLLECCGRFLLRTEATAERMRSLLELLRRKRAAKSLDHRHLLLLDNAYFHCNPPERRAAEVKHRSTLELYIRHLIYDRLNRRSVSQVLKLLRKLPWSDPEVLTVLGEIFIRVWRVKFSDIHLLAILLADLQPFHPDFIVAVTDAVCEEVRVGMETNLFKFNQRRMAIVQYIGELYNYRLINSALIFDQLWSFVTFGHIDGRPFPGQVAQLDAPDDFFRIRLVCTLLDVCGVCFDRGAQRRRLDEFLAYLNLYVLSKEQPLPMDVDFMLSDTLEILRPDFVLKRDWNEAAAVADEMMSRHRSKAVQAQQDGRPDEAAVEDGEESDSEDEEDAVGEDGERKKRLPRNKEAVDDEVASIASSHTGDEQSVASTDATDSEAGEDEEEAVVVDRRTAQQTQEELEAEEDFARELAKMMADTSISGGSGGGGGGASRGGLAQHRGNLFDQGIPFLKKSGSTSDANTAEGSHSTRQDEMRFSLLSKRGNKFHTNTLHLPSDSRIAVTTREQQLKEMQERKQLKEFVLGYEGREEASERKDLQETFAKRGIRVKQGK